MFNRNKIEKLRNDLDFLASVATSMKSDFDKKIELLEDEIWKLKNPPKFKVGQKVSYCIVLDVFLRKMTVHNFINGTSSPDYYWEYETFNTVFSSRKFLKQPELSSIELADQFDENLPKTKENVKPTKKK